MSFGPSDNQVVSADVRRVAVKSSDMTADGGRRSKVRYLVAMGTLLRCAVVGVLFWGGAVAGAQMVSPKTPPPQHGSETLDVKPVPLLSLDSLNFLEGTWAADVGPGADPVGSYAFVRELGGHVLARRSPTDVACTLPGSTVCAHRDLLYVYQDSAGAPLKAIYFDAEGHVIQYGIEIKHFEVASGRQDYAIFLSDPAALGPRFRLTYERNTDTRTDKTEMTGTFEVLLPNGKWKPYLQWGGRMLASAKPR